MMTSFRGMLTLLLMTAGVSLASERQPLPLIPRTLLDGNEHVRQVRLSPDGKWIAYLAPWKNVMNVWILDVSTLGHTSEDGAEERPEGIEQGRSRRKDKPLTFDRNRGIHTIMWTHYENHLIYFADKDGDENWRMSILDVASGSSTSLVHMEGVQTLILAMSHRRPHEIVISMNSRDPRYHDPYYLNLQNSERTLIVENNRFKSFRFDNDLKLRMAEEDRLSGGTDFFIPMNLTDGNLYWRPYRSLNREDAEGTRPLRFDLTNTKVYWLESTQSDVSSLVLSDYDDPSSKVLLHRPLRSDISDVVFHAAQSLPMFAYENYFKRVIVLLEPTLRSDISILEDVAPHSSSIMNIEHVTVDFSKWLVAVDSDRSPPKYYLYDRSKRHAEHLFTQREQLLLYNLSATYPIEIRSRDGLTQVCYLTLPPESDTHHVGRPDKPLPMVLSVHGGPWARDSWGFNSDYQLYSNRGYATLSCNYRGSIGYGKQFLNAGNGEWGGKMQDDLIDAAQWAIEQEIADEKRLAIVGTSYGGYAALAGLTFTPEFFSCAVNVVGPSNMVTLQQSVPPYWRPIYETMKYRMGGDSDTPEGRAFLASRSPLTFVNQIKKPLLIGQGANDPRVKQAESDQIVHAMKKAGIPVTYVLFPNEGHGWSRAANRRAFTAIVERFLAACLGGRAEEATREDFSESSVQILEYGDLDPSFKDLLNHELPEDASTPTSKSVTVVVSIFWTIAVSVAVFRLHINVDN